MGKNTKANQHCTQHKMQPMIVVWAPSAFASKTSSGDRCRMAGARVFYYFHLISVMAQGAIQWRVTSPGLDETAEVR